MTPQDVLVVGGAGYLGCVLVPMLQAQGHRVTVIDRGYFGFGGLPDGTHVLSADMRSLRMLPPADALINIGGLSNDPTAEFNERANYEMNTDAAIALAELARDCGIRRYIYASSASLYDFGLSEKEDRLFDEDAEVHPVKPYSRSKWLAEQGLLPMSSPDFAVTVLRKGTLYGQSPRMRYDLVVNKMVRDAVTTGKLQLYSFGAMWRPMVSVRDAASAYCLVLETPVEAVAGCIFNVVEANWRISELSLRVQSALRSCGVPASIEPVDAGVPRNYRIDGARLRALGWVPAATVPPSTIEMARYAVDAQPDMLYHPRHQNIAWMQLLDETRALHGATGSIFDREE